MTCCIFTYGNSFKPVFTEFYGKSCFTNLKYDNCNCLQREDGDRRCEKQSGCHWGDLGVTKISSYQANSTEELTNLLSARPHYDIITNCPTIVWGDTAEMCFLASGRDKSDKSAVFRQELNVFCQLSVSGLLSPGIIVTKKFPV